MASMGHPFRCRPLRTRADQSLADLLQEYPPAPFGMRFVKEDLAVKRYDIPKGWMVVYGFAGALAAKIEAESDKAAIWKSFFQENAQVAGPPSGSIAFGSGPRMCPGRYLASLELTTLCQKLTTTNSISWNLQKGQNLQQTYNPGFFPKDGLRIKLMED